MAERDKSVEDFVLGLDDKDLLKEIEYVTYEIECIDEEQDPEEQKNRKDLVNYLRYMKVHLDLRKWRYGELDRATVVINAEYEEKIRDIPPYKRVRRPKKTSPKL